MSGRQTYVALSAPGLSGKTWWKEVQSFGAAGWVGGDSAWNSHCTGIRSALERNGQTLIGQLLKRSWTCNGLKSNAHSKIVKGPIQSAASFLRIEYFIFSSIYVTLVKFNLIKELSSLCGRTWAILASGV